MAKILKIMAIIFSNGVWYRTEPGLYYCMS